MTGDPVDIKKGPPTVHHFRSPNILLPQKVPNLQFIYNCWSKCHEKWMWYLDKMNWISEGGIAIHQPPITPRVFSVVQIRPNQAISDSYSYNSSVKRYAIHSNPHSDSQPGVQTICILFMPNHFGDKIEHAFLLSQETYSRKGNFWHQHIVLWMKRIFENLSPTFEIIPTSWEISHEFLCQGFGAHRDIMNRRKTWTANDLWRGLGFGCSVLIWATVHF